MLNQLLREKWKYKTPSNQNSVDQCWMVLIQISQDTMLLPYHQVLFNAMPCFWSLVNVFLSSFCFLTEMHWIYWKRPLSQKQPQPWRPQLPHFLSPHQQLLLRPLAADPTYLLCLYQGNLEPRWASRQLSFTSRPLAPPHIDTLQPLQHLIQTRFWLAASSGLKVLVCWDGDCWINSFQGGVFFHFYIYIYTCLELLNCCPQTKIN